VVRWHDPSAVDIMGLATALLVACSAAVALPRLLRLLG
jgi:hypothetical protein